MLSARVFLALLLAAWVAFVALPARAELTPGGKRVALIIGNGDYRNVDHLPNATNDAKLMAETLRGLGFSIVGGGARLNLDRAQLEASVRDFGNALAGAEVALFYYSGHGLQVKGVNWLVPVDASPSSERDLDFQMVDADLVLRQMDGIGTKLNIVLLDACRNNPFAVRGLRALQAGLAEMHAPEGTLISYATQPGNVAVDGAGADSPYTEALAHNMKQPGLDIFRLFNQVGLQVKKGTDGRQQPWVSTSPIDGDFYFAGPAAAAPSAPLPAAAPPPVTTALATPPAQATVTRPIATPPAAQPPVTTVLAAPPTPSTVVPPTVTPPAVAASPVSPPTITPSPVTPSGVTPSLASPPAVPPRPWVQPRETMALAVPAPPPASRPDQDPDATVRGLVDRQPCSILDARQQDGHVTLVGLARGGPEWDDLLRRLNATRAIRIGTPQVEILPEFACPVVDVLRDPVREARSSDDHRLIASPPEIADGVLTITLRRAADARLRLDLFGPKGFVFHLAPRQEARNGDDTRFSAQMPKLLPAQRLLTAIVTDAPLAVGPRPGEERSVAWLAALSDALRSKPGGLRADMVVFETPAATRVAPVERPRPASTAVIVRPAGRPARCHAILERAQLGEAVSQGDRAFLREACR